jgi:hypothetical protein
MGTNVEGREGGVYTWRATLLFDCQNSNCKAATMMEGYGGKTLEIPAPVRGGTLEISFSIRTYANIGAVGTIYHNSDNAQQCTCTGVRTPVDFASLTPETGSNGGGSGPGDSTSGKSGIDTSSAGFLGGVIAASALVGLAAVGAGVYFWKARGLNRRSASGLRTGAASTSSGGGGGGGGSVAAASATLPAGGGTVGADGKTRVSAAPTLAARRSSYQGNLQPVNTQVTETSSAAAAKRDSPAQQTKASPAGDRRV